MASSIDICNLALGNIRAGSINSLDEASLEAQVCKQRYQLAVDFVLRDFPWRFAHKTQALALLDTTHPEWTYVYAYPSDCLRAKYILPASDVINDRTVYYHLEDFGLDQRYRKVTFEVGMDPDGSGRVILTNKEEAYLAYTAKQTDTTVFTADFVEALSWYLAAFIAIPLVGPETGRKLREDSLKLYEMTIKTAAANDANESLLTYPMLESETIRVRGG